MERGYLDSREMSNMFNLLRSNDLIWANVVNNYLLGNKPPAFDLLYWNSDGTRMTRAAHSWYLRNTYIENNLIKPGKITLKGEPIDLGRIRARHLRGRARRRTTSCPGTPRGASRSCSAATCGSCSPPAAISPASSTRRAARAPTGPRELEDAAATSRSSGCRAPRGTRAAGGRTGRPGFPPAQARKASRRRWAAQKHPPLEDAPGTYVLEKIGRSTAPSSDISLTSRGAKSATRCPSAHQRRISLA